MSLTKFKRMPFAAMLAVVLTHSPVAQACDDAAKQPSTVKVSVERPSASVQELISQLETLVKPVCAKVSICNEELEQAQAAVDSLSGKLTCVVAEQAKSLRALKLLKHSLEQPGCTIKIDSQRYDRETVGAAIEVKLSAYRAQSSTIGCLSKELMVAQQNLEKVAAKVASWVAKEKELLAQIESLEDASAQSASEVASIQEQVSVLSSTINEMLKPAATNTATTSRPLSKPEAELVAEVDQALSQK